MFETTNQLMTNNDYMIYMFYYIHDSWKKYIESCKSMTPFLVLLVFLHFQRLSDSFKVA